MKPTISFSDWEKLDIRVGKILEVEEIPDSDKLYKLIVDFGKEIGKRTICAGLREYIPKENLKGKKSIFLINLEPRSLRGVESQGMILAAGNKEDDVFTILEPSQDLDEGTKVS